MTFSEDYGKLLSPFLKEYKKANNEKARKAVIKNAADAISSSSGLLEDKGASLPKNLKTVISRYMDGQMKEKSTGDDVDEVKPTKIKQFYTVRDVVKQNYKELVEAEIPFKSTEKNYIANYQRAVTKVIDQMSEEDLEELEKIVDLWNAKGAPVEVQRKRAKTKLPKEIKKKVDEWKFSSGAMVMCLVAYSDGENVQAFHVESSPAVGNSFTNSCPDWREGTYEGFKDWAVRQFGLKDLESGDEAEVPVNLKKAKDITFKVNRKGHLVLLPLSNFRKTRERQRVVRGYIGAVYRKFTGNARASFPYILASKEGQKVYSPESAPEGFSLIDPDHLTNAQATSLYNHWLERQRKGLSPFVVISAGPLHAMPSQKPSNGKGKNKKKPEYLEVATDEESVADDSDEDPKVGTADAEEEVDADEEVDLEEEVTPVVKYGPPIAKKKSQPSKGFSTGTKARSPTGAKLRSRRKKGDGEKFEGPSSNASPGTSKTTKQKGGPPKQPKGAVTPARSKTTAIAPMGLEQTEPEAEEDDRPQTRQSRKRKAEEELEKEVSPKLRKMDAVGKSGSLRKKELKKAEVGKKRPAEENENPNAKRKKTTAGGSSKATPISPTKRPKVKEFPAGNTATSAARIAFLQSLCNLKNYLFLVDKVEPVPKASPVPKTYPKWASWTSREVFLPEDFHSRSAFRKVMNRLKKDLETSLQEDAQGVDAVLLLLGLTHRELSRTMEIEPGDSSSPDHLASSPLGREELDEVQSLINSLEVQAS